MAKYDSEISILDRLISEMAVGEGDWFIEKNSLWGMPDDIAVIIWGYAHLEYNGDILPERICFGKEYGTEVFERLLSKREDYISFQKYIENGYFPNQINSNNLKTYPRRMSLE